jgi:hypothetical protein
MHHFAYRNGVMHCENVSLEAIARTVCMKHDTTTISATQLAAP